MTQTIAISGMHCGGCVSKVQSALQSITGVSDVVVQLLPPEARITVHHALNEQCINAALATAGAYSVVPQSLAALVHESVPQERSWFATYKPLLLVVAFILGGVALVQINNDALSAGIDWMLAMNTFMGGFFVVFSFFKLLDVQAFADSYSMYDVLARSWRGWGLVYPFVELALGIAYLTHTAPILTNATTLVVMSLSIVGVIQSRLNKRAIQCACLGAVFNLPMSSVTIIEDSVMIAMSAWMLVWMA